MIALMLRSSVSCSAYRAVVFSAAVALGLTSDVVHAQLQPAENADPPVTILAARLKDTELLDRSRIWYVLSQENAPDLLFGMPQRLGRAIPVSRRKEPLWLGVDDGGSVELVVELDQGLGGEVFVGFFGDPRWWLAEPVQVRSFTKPGRHVVYAADRLPPGKYWVGAMLGSLPYPKALGVHGSWPEPIEVQAGQTTTAELRVSGKFKDKPAGQPNLEEGFAGQWAKLDRARTVTVHTVDSGGSPLPFCSVVLCERNPKDRDRYTWFRQFGTDEHGDGFNDQVTEAFSVNTQRFDVVPEQLAFRYLLHRQANVRELADSKEISVKCRDFPTGSGKISGRVHDTDGQPLTGYFLWLERTVGKLRGIEEYEAIGIQLPVIDDDGRFTIGGLSAGDYEIRAFDFDSMRYEWMFATPKRIHLPDEDGAEVMADIELEARALRYGIAVDEDGKPVGGGWTTRFNPATNDMRSLNFERDSSFRVVLSKSEREKLTANSDGVVECYTFGAGDDRAEAFVAFDDLSSDPARPTKVVLRRGAKAPPKKKRPAPGAAVGGTGAFNLADTTGRSHRLSDYRGKVVLVNFFGTTCSPCMLEWPHLVELSKERADAGLVVLAVSSQPADELERFVQRRKPPFAVLIDTEYEAAGQFRDDPFNLPLPTNVLIDRRGRTVLLMDDYTEDKFAELIAKVKELLKEPKAAESESE